MARQGELKEEPRHVVETGQRARRAKMEAGSARGGLRSRRLRGLPMFNNDYYPLGA